MIQELRKEPNVLVLLLNLYIINYILEKKALNTVKTSEFCSGLYYFNARWYDPKTEGFTTEDPIRDGVNWFVEPAGLKAVENDTIDNDSFYDPETDSIRDTPEAVKSLDNYFDGSYLEREKTETIDSDVTENTPTGEDLASGAVVLTNDEFKVEVTVVSGVKGLSEAHNSAKMPIKSGVQGKTQPYDPLTGKYLSFKANSPTNTLPRWVNNSSSGRFIVGTV